MATTTIVEKTVLLAFHGKPAIKDGYLARVRQHREMDQILQGYGYWKDGKGCAVGCTIHSSSHDRYETELGIPVALAHLEDATFEALPVEAAREWPFAFLDAIPVGADLSMVVPQFLYWLLADDADGVIRYADREKWPACYAAITKVSSLFKRLLSGEVIDRSEWVNSRLAAYDAAAYAAYDAAAYAADAAADAAYAAAYDAADAAAYAAYARPARENARIRARVRQSEKLLELLRAAPVVRADPDAHLGAVESA